LHFLLFEYDPGNLICYKTAWPARNGSVQTGYGAQRPIQWVAWVKRQGREAEHSPPTTAEYRERWSYTSNPPNGTIFISKEMNSLGMQTALQSLPTTAITASKRKTAGGVLGFHFPYLILVVALKILAGLLRLPVRTGNSYQTVSY
jgi:hypothetical protein